MIDRIARFFVVQPVGGGPRPAQEPRPGRWEPPASAPRRGFVVVLAARGCAAGAGAAIGLVLAGQGDGVSVVCTWSPETEQRVDEATGAPLLAAPMARRMARVLQARDLPAVARGRLVAVAVPAGAVEAARAVARVRAVDAPVVLVVDGPRDRVLDGLLAEADRVVVATSPDTSAVLVELALADAARASRSAGHLVVASSPAGAIASSGLMAPPALRHAAEAALR